MKLIPNFLAKPFVIYATEIEVKNEPLLMDTTEVGHQARKEYDRAFRLKLLLSLPLFELLRKREEVLRPNPARYI